MVRYQKEQITKHEGRKLMQEMWPSGWSVRRKVNNVDVCFHDGLQLLNDIGNSPQYNLRPHSIDNMKFEDESLVDVESASVPTYSMRDMVKAIKDVIESYMKGNTRIKDYVLCFDKCQYVPIAKSQAQDAHTKDKKIVPADQLPPIRLGLDEELDVGLWSSYLADRRGYRRDIITFVVCELMDKTGPCCVSLPVGKRLIIDGHGLSIPQLEYLLGEYSGEYLSQFSEKERSRDDEGFSGLECYPICLSTEEIEPEDKCDLLDYKVVSKVELLKDYHNVIGEADFAPFFYIERRNNKVHKDNPYKGVEIISVDTDLAYLSLIYLEKLSLVKREHKPSIYIRQSRLSVTVNIQYLFVNQLYDDIVNDQRLNGFGKYPIASLICALVSAGSDYTDYHYYVPYSHFITTLLTRLHKHGPLLQVDVDMLFKQAPPNQYQQITKVNQIKQTTSLNASAYIELILYSYAYARSDRIPVEEFGYVTCRNINKYFDGTYGKNAYKDPRMLFPCIEDIIVSAKQVLYYMEMCYCAGESNVDTLSPFEYGYKLVNPEKGFVRGNVYRIIIN